MKSSNKITTRFLIFGVLFGLLFPLLGTIVYLQQEGISFSLQGILNAHSDSNLLKIIDLAPFILGAVGLIIGKNQARLVEMSTELSKTNSSQKTSLDSLTRENQLKSQDLEHMAYHTAHDFKSALRGIASLNAHIEEETDETAKSDLLILRNKRVNRMDNLLDSMLHYLRLTKKEVKLEGVELQSYVQEIAKPYNITINVKGGTAFKVKGDKTRIKEIFNELFKNSIQYSKSDTSNIFVDIEHQGAYVTALYSDDAIEIEDQYRDKIFLPFSMLSSRDETESMGMGLAIARRLMHDMGGEIELSEKPKTKFELHFNTN